MKTGWKALIVAGAVLALVSSPVLAQPWGGGAGWGRGFGRGQGPGPGGMTDQPGPLRPGMGPGGRQGGPGAWCPWGAGPRGRGLWSAPEPGPAGLGRLFASRLGLTNDQIEKIRDILEQSRSKTMAAIKEVLTPEQVKQLGLMRERATQFGRGMRGPAPQDGLGGPAGRGFPRGQGRGAGLGPRGQGPAGQPFAGGPGAGRGLRPQGGMNRPDAAVPPRTRGRGVGPVPSRNRGLPPIEQMFDQADMNKDGALTREEIRAFHERREAGPEGRRE